MNEGLTYNGIAELNRFYFDNYTYAAAYYIHHAFKYFRRSTKMNMMLVI